MGQGQGIGLNNLLCYWATGQTGTGSAQNIAHPMGRVPAFVIVMPSGGNDCAHAVGTSTSSNISVVVANRATFDVVAFWSRD